jgi:phage/plasmid primase-like uncharacterized protein
MVSAGDSPTDAAFYSARTGEASTSLSELVQALAGSIRELSCELTGGKPTSRTGRHWRFGSKGSLAVVVEGAERGAWFDHEAGQGGDALGLVAHLRRCPMRDAFAWAVAWLGMERRPAPLAIKAKPVAATPPSSTTDLARRIWSEGQASRETLVQAYLSSRGLTVPKDAPLRFHPACPRGAERLPAMLALMTDPVTGQPCGVHRTFLAADGSGKAAGQAKMMAGNAGVVRLVPDEEVTAGLGLAEGIETALAVMQGFGWSPVWAATSAGSITSFPVLPGIEALTIFADADDKGAGQKAAAACAERWSRLGREATILAAPSGHDFHDSMRRAG